MMTVPRSFWGPFARGITSSATATFPSQSASLCCVCRFSCFEGFETCSIACFVKTLMHAKRGSVTALKKKKKMRHATTHGALDFPEHFTCFGLSRIVVFCVGPAVVCTSRRRLPKDVESLAHAAWHGPSRPQARIPSASFGLSPGFFSLLCRPPTCLELGDILVF